MPPDHGACVARISSAMRALARLLEGEISLSDDTTAGLGVVLDLLGERLEAVAGDLLDAA